ncbi:MAG: hypothetical protein A3C35_06940 [Omnitrophica bacterium RIFCSPHIGHO2_02_FULL_46_11]|nr:MAG: hypothetical protein A3A81_06910 [Omnitrophica bacterium RIFCSPLOWO2_01_FULL_45_10b]OGW87221.1 MAG: hypothetical protein A3C35_06940 [Omnitrophica bacterium RIFCSPHIGHO2_02_FULL_46_11]
MVQGELFREENINDLNKNASALQNSFLTRHRLTLTLDKFVIAAIGFVVLFALTFSFGVERGKRAMEKRLASLFPTHSEVLPPTGVKEGHSADPAQGTVLLVKDQAVETSTTEATTSEAAKADESSAINSSQTTSAIEGAGSTESSNQGKYTIQLVTYKNSKMAEREVTSLKSKGHDGFVIASGNYFQVCANFAQTHSKAKVLLKQFRETGRYPDAFIRPVVR